MTPEEAAFQTQLDADPYDQNARAAFADWLEDQSDPRAEAVRELWRRGWVPFLAPCDVWTAGAYNSPTLRDGNPDVSMLPKWWWERVRKGLAESNGVDQSDETHYE